MIRRRLRDLADSLRCWPGLGGWARAAAELGWALPLMLVFTHLGGLVRVEGMPQASTALVLAATLFVAPALGEELLFRGLLIPRAGAKQRGSCSPLGCSCCGIHFKR